MNTPSHLHLVAAAFAKPEDRKVTWAALFGGFAPDLSLYLMGGVAIFILGISPETVFRDLYFSQGWQQVFAIDNSFILWGIALGIAIWTRTAWAVAMCGAALLHIAFDFPLHADDARMHFWPITEWRFYSPISYWETSRGGATIGALEMALVVAVTALLVYRFKSLPWRALFVSLAALQVAPALMWALFF